MVAQGRGLQDGPNRSTSKAMVLVNRNQAFSVSPSAHSLQKEDWLADYDTIVTDCIPKLLSFASMDARKTRTLYTHAASSSQNTSKAWDLKSLRTTHDLQPSTERKWY